MQTIIINLTREDNYGKGPFNIKNLDVFTSLLDFYFEATKKKIQKKDSSKMENIRKNIFQTTYCD